LESFTLCPECGHKQAKAEACVRCGFILESRYRVSRVH
jgi:ribosomal protein L37E